MANSTTVKNVANLGNMIVEVGVLTMGDGASGLAVQSAVKDYMGGVLTQKSAANCSGITFVSGGFKALTAISGNDFQYVVFGT